MLHVELQDQHNGNSETLEGENLAEIQAQLPETCESVLEARDDAGFLRGWVSRKDWRYA